MRHLAPLPGPAGPEFLDYGYFKMSFADTLSDRERRRARLYAYASTLSGCISEVMFDSTAIIILFFTMLKASAMATMFSSSLSGLTALFLMIPGAVIVDRIGLKPAVKYACSAGFVGFLLIVAAPWLGETLAVPAALLGTVIFCAQRSLYSSAWYPLLDGFLRLDERGRFFAVMRTGYMIFTGTLFFLVGLLLGDEPPMWLMQLVIGIAGAALLIRWYCISKFPEDPEAVTGRYDFRGALRTSIRNAPLTGFSTYLCLLSVAYTSLLPLALIYLRKGIGADPGTVQLLSTVGIGGSVCGYFVYGVITGRVKLKWLEAVVHVTFIVLALLLFWLDRNTPGFFWYVGAILFVLAVANSWVMCNNSMEYLALARPGNKTMALAFCQTYLNLGTAIGRLGCSALLGCALLSPVWTWGGRDVCVYQSLFLLIAAVAAFALVMVPILPSFAPRHEDYYQSAD